MRFKKIYMSILVAALTLAFSGCNDNVDPLVKELNLDRVLSPAGVTAFIRNQTSIELNWTIREGVEQYQVEFSEDSLEFASIIRTVSVTPDELPITEKFFGNTRYSARVKAIGVDGKDDSKWSAITVKTEPENILLPIDVMDNTMEGTTITWPVNEEATKFVINPGNIERAITVGEVTAGEAVITGLDYYTDYQITMYAGNSQRGYAEFRTLMNPDCPTCIKLNPGDNISTALAGAADGAIIVLTAGDYPAQGSIAVDKSITIQGAVYYDQPVVYGQITCATTVNSLKVISTTFRGDGATPQSQFFNTVSGCNLTSFLIKDCDISNYSNNFIYNNASGTFGDITIDESYVHDIPGGGGDGIDFRGGAITSLNVMNTTFANGFRTFLRMQVACAGSFKNCTFYRTANNDNGNNNGHFRMSGGGTFEVSSCLFVETGVTDFNDPANARGNFCRQASYMVDAPIYSNNNIFGCYNIFGGLYTAPSAVSATEFDPQFVDPATGDFTVTNQTIIDSKIGDPKWLP